MCLNEVKGNELGSNHVYVRKLPADPNMGQIGKRRVNTLRIRSDIILWSYVS